MRWLVLRVSSEDVAGTWEMRPGDGTFSTGSRRESVHSSAPDGARAGLNAAMETPLLWHIPLSHYNEKVRWALDYKRIPHRRRVLGPDYLIRAWRATGQGKLPILWLDGRAIADSTRIIAALEERYPDPSLYPSDAGSRARALGLEDDLDDTLGPA